MSDTLPFAKKAFLMLFPHMHKHLVIAEQTFAAKLAKRMRSAVFLILLLSGEPAMPIIA